jgi:hypothetical protein
VKNEQTVEQHKSNAKGVNMSERVGRQKTSQVNMKKGIKVGPDGSRRAAALDTLRSVNFFSHLREAFRSMGMAGWEGQAAVGVYFIAISSFQAYPLRVQIQERTEGTVAYILQKVEDVLLPGSVVTIWPDDDEKWSQFTEFPNEKLVIIPQLKITTKEGVARFDVRGDQIIRVVPKKTEDRVVNQFWEAAGRFACISSDRPDWSLRRARWLTMTQPEREDVAPGDGAPVDIDTWQEVARVLQERARLPVVLPQWAQLIVEQMCERDDRAMRCVPALEQMWRTMCLIQSFQSKENDKAKVLNATFEDLAAATLLAKKVFREGCWFPSCKKLFVAIPGLPERTAVIHPVTGKVCVYKQDEKPVSAQHQSVLDFNE